MSNITVTPLYEGTFSVGTDKKFIRIRKSDPPRKASLKLSINPFLIQDGERNLLFDAGLGDLFGEDTSIDTIIENLAEKSISEYEITDVFLSHLHFDHIAGIANQKNGYWELTFPEATVWTLKKDWEQLRVNIDKENEIKKDFFHFIDSRADLKFLSEKEQPVPHVRTQTIGGHTEFHQALFYENGDNRYVMAGDVIGTRGAINRTYAAKYDFAPKQSTAVRKELQKLAFDKGYIFMAYHETDHPLFKLTDFEEKKGYNIENIL